MSLHEHKIKYAMALIIGENSGLPDLVSLTLYSQCSDEYCLQQFYNSKSFTKQEMRLAKVPTDILIYKITEARKELIEKQGNPLGDKYYTSVQELLHKNHDKIVKLFPILFPQGIKTG